MLVLCCCINIRNLLRRKNIDKFNSLCDFNAMLLPHLSALFKSHFCFCRLNADRKAWISHDLFHHFSHPEFLTLIFSLCSPRLKDDAKKLVEELGSKEIKNIKFRSSWVFIAAKGFKLPDNIQKEKVRFGLFSLYICVYTKTENFGNNLPAGFRRTKDTVFHRDFCFHLCPCCVHFL